MIILTNFKSCSNLVCLLIEPNSIIFYQIELKSRLSSLKFLSINLNFILIEPNLSRIWKVIEHKMLFNWLVDEPSLDKLLPKKTFYLENYFLAIIFRCLVRLWKILSNFSVWCLLICCKCFSNMVLFTNHVYFLVTIIYTNYH